ncbi:outer envelope pore protein 37, chloroplastic isoform X1 [Dendrobium catenatum]|uniref:outer envelope pore protein 37, chloroplastic isoform X1 n=1 Tax=Dendrobium catenatum TaxID=906689 RepID=UPI0009F45C63|nr:outer envelope pore protein 37, chloroplastic isoform X1 [Dendrobium catenatum]
MGDEIPSCPSPIYLLPPAPPPTPSPTPDPLESTTRNGGFTPNRRPPLRFTTEFDSEGPLFLHKVSCKFFDSLAKLKFSFQNNTKGEIFCPQLGFITKNLSVLYDFESRNALLRGSLDLGQNLQLRTTYDVQSDQIWIPEYIGIRWSTKYSSVSFNCKNKKSILTSLYFGSVFQFNYQYHKEQLGAVAVIASLPNPSVKLELSSSVPSNGLPRAALQFPYGEIALEQRENVEEKIEGKKILSVDGILKSPMLNGIGTVVYNGNDLNLRYIYKDTKLSFIPCINLPSNKVSFAFKRRFSPSDKFSYWYHFDSSAWSAVYKHTIGKDLKIKAGYDSDVRLGWASLWVGPEDGKTKDAPRKLKAQMMLQVPQDGIKSSALMFRVKKRWDF